MTTVSEQTPPAQPLLMKFAVSRMGKSELPGEYDDTRQVWTIQTPAGPEPIVRSTNVQHINELATKTDVKTEQDDPGYNSLVELVTKTAHQTEKDDVPPRSLCLVELITITKVGGEKPDIA